MTSSIQPRRITDKTLGFDYIVTSMNERVNISLKRMLSPKGKKWLAYTYVRRNDEEYTLAIREPLNTSDAMRWLSGDDSPKRCEPAATFEIKAKLTKRELSALKRILTSDAIPATSHALEVQTALLRAIEAATE